jgi:hypothetical protein
VGNSLEADMTTNVAADPAVPNEQLFDRPFLALRAAVGFLGFALPVVLMAGDGIWLKGGDVPRSSLSAYYHTGMRDVLVGVLCAIAFFLVAYKIFDGLSLDNVLSAVAGAAAVGVALFPTEGSSPLTPLQERLGESAVGDIHFACAAVFIGALAVISWRFGKEEKDQANCPGRERPARKWLHRACAVVIVLAVAYMLANAVSHLSPHAVFWGETAATWAFGVSWLAAGELSVLFGSTRTALDQLELAA